MRKKQIFKRSGISALLSGIVPVLFSLVMIVMIVYGLKQTEISNRAEGMRILEDGIRRAAVTCYAIEGFYPDTIGYIEDHYGINIDRTRYAVYYVVFASNIMPDITVLEAQ